MLEPLLKIPKSLMDRASAQGVRTVGVYHTYIDEELYTEATAKPYSAAYGGITDAFQDWAHEQLGRRSFPGAETGHNVHINMTYYLEDMVVVYVYREESSRTLTQDLEIAED